MRELSLRIIVIQLIPLILAGLPAPLAAGEEMGLWDCVEAAVTGHIAVKAGRWRVEQARNTVEQDRTLFKPDFSFGAHYTANSYVPKIPLPGRSLSLGGHNDTGVILEVGQLLYDWGARRDKLEADQDQQQSSFESLRALREHLAFEAGAGYLRLLAARSERKIAERSVETADEHYRHLQALGNSGLLTYDEVLKGKVHLEQARLMLSRGANAEKLARSELLLRVGVPLTSATEFADSAGEIPQPLPAESRLDSALARRPELAAYDSRLASLESMAAGLASENKPVLRLFANGNVARPGIDQFRNEWIGYGRAGIGMSWNFFDWGRKDFAVAKIKAQWEETLADRRILGQQIALEVEQSSLTAEEAGQRLSVAHSGLDAAGEHFRIVRSRFEQGQITNTEFIDAEDEETVSAIEVARAELDLGMARWQLAYATGELTARIDERWAEKQTDLRQNNP